MSLHQISVKTKAVGVLALHLPDPQNSVFKIPLLSKEGEGGDNSVIKQLSFKFYPF